LKANDVQRLGVQVHLDIQALVRVIQPTYVPGGEEELSKTVYIHRAIRSTNKSKLAQLDTTVTKLGRSERVSRRHGTGSKSEPIYTRC
jgi:hypothetical protein